MPECRRCKGPIRWAKGEGRWVPLNPDGSLHKPTCAAPTTCRYCNLPVFWREHEGKRQCFELDGQTLHNDVCAHRDECAHCGQKVEWLQIEGKWLAMDRTFPRELHWALCPRNPDGAKDLVKRLHALASENAKLRAQIESLEGDARYHRVELARLTKAAGLNGPK